MTGRVGTTGSPAGQQHRGAQAARRPDIVVCEDVSRTFGRGPTAMVALQSSSCRIPAAARIAIAGASGSGKSTLLHLLAGLDRPTTGQVSWPGLTTDGEGRDDEEAVDGRSVDRHAVGVVFQTPSLIPALTVTENVALPRILAGDPTADATGRATRALARLELTALAARLPEELSGGQAQRVAVARVLAQNPRLILADEPTGQLDSRTAAHLINVLLRTATHIQATLVVATHDPVVAARLDHQWRMREGKLDTQHRTDRS